MKEKRKKCERKMKRKKRKDKKIRKGAEKEFGRGKEKKIETSTKEIPGEGVACMHKFGTTIPGCAFRSTQPTLFTLDPQ